MKGESVTGAEIEWIRALRDPQKYDWPCSPKPLNCPSAAWPYPHAPKNKGEQLKRGSRDTFFDCDSEGPLKN